MNSPHAPPTRRPWPRQLVVLFLAALLTFAPPAPAQSTGHEWRFGFSARAFIGINENDAKAATRVWAQTVGREKNLRVHPEARTYRSVEEIAQALRQGAVDMVVLSAPEYLALDPQIRPTDLISQTGIEGEEYVLLAGVAGGITNPAGVCGRTLYLQDGFRSSLALPWLDTLLLAAGRGPSGESVGKIELAHKPTQAVLPVFFGKADACLVSQSAYDTMTEMNPQIRQRLRLIARSPKFLSAFMVLRLDLEADLKRTIASAMGELHQSPAGAQILSLFQGQPLAKMPLSVLDSARAMLAQREQLLSDRERSTSAAGGGPTP